MKLSMTEFFVNERAGWRDGNNSKIYQRATWSGSGGEDAQGK
jgi:hypothetical protein